MAEMRLYNTLTRTKEEFVPLEDGKVKMYVCGPTVYNYFHIGNARPFIVFDVLRNFLAYKGYDVTYVQNFTDVDDKIINAAKTSGVSPKELSETFIEAYFEDARSLGIADADVHPKVSENIPEIIAIIESLIASGHAYQKNGDVYYRVASFPEYGALSGQSTDELLSGARVDVNEEKESPLDFALWKAMKEGEPFWPSPFGPGRPGWHIECSAMSRKYLGVTIDIHGGGSDLVFPHHTNEIAQSEGSSGKPFVRYWLHNGFINMGEEKMSKSLGNFFTARDILKSYGGEAIRLFILSVQYRGPLAFSDEALKAAEAGLERLYNAKENLAFLLGHANSARLSTAEEEALSRMEALKESFEAAMEDDLNTANAISALYEMARLANSSFDETSSKEGIQKALDIYLSAAGVLRLLKKEAGLLDSEIEELIDERNAARAAKDFARADEIRDELKSKGILLEDTKQGVKWKRA